jgi:cyclic lactone autoinducer peptide
MNKLIMKLGGLIASVALAVTALNVNSTCICLIHQPRLPEGASKLRRCE